MKIQFPIKFTVTEEIIKAANIFNATNCIGALSLKAALGKNSDLCNSWCSGYGHLRWDNRLGDLAGTEVWSVNDKGESINMMEITHSREVIFTLEQPSK